MKPYACPKAILLCLMILLVCGCSSAGSGGRAPTTAAAGLADTPDEAGLRAFLEGAIARANLAASEIDDKVFVDHLDLRRVIYFVP